MADWLRAVLFRGTFSSTMLQRSMLVAMLLLAGGCGPRCAHRVRVTHHVTAHVEHQVVPVFGTQSGGWVFVPVFVPEHDEVTWECDQYGR